MLCGTSNLHAKVLNIKVYKYIQYGHLGLKVRLKANFLSKFWYVYLLFLLPDKLNKSL